MEGIATIVFGNSEEVAKALEHPAWFGTVQMGREKFSVVANEAALLEAQGRVLPESVLEHRISPQEEAERTTMALLDMVHNEQGWMPEAVVFE